jgi:hypothetical protein
MTFKPHSVEFDITVLTALQQNWLYEHATHHHFDGVVLEKIDSTGAVMTLHYDDGPYLTFFVKPNGVGELL